MRGSSSANFFKILHSIVKSERHDSKPKVIASGETFKLSRKYRDYSKYKPHQGKQECARRLKNAERRGEV